MNITIRVDAKGAIGWLRHVHQRQIPFATSKALNQTANDVQAAIRQSLPGLGFTLRRKAFIERTIYRQPGVDFSTKHKLSAGVRIHPQRDVIAKFETDTVKRPDRGSNLAIPGPAVRPNFSAVVGKAWTPKALGQKAFKLKLKRGGYGLFWRVARRNEFLYTLKPHVPLNHVLHFVDTARRTVALRWALRMVDAFNHAVRTAR
jgi:hypothetical protein